MRGGTRTGPNYDAEHVAKVCAQLAAKGLRETVMIDCSHANSSKQHQRQIDVARDIGEQLKGGDARIVGVMIDEPSNGVFYGGAVAAPVFSEVVQQTLRLMGVQPDMAVKPQVVATQVEESF